jgi:hypothetical protein
VINLLTKCFEEFNKSFYDDLERRLLNELKSLDFLNELKQEIDNFVQILLTDANKTMQMSSLLNDLLFKMIGQFYSIFERINTNHYSRLVSAYLKNEFDNNIRLSHRDIAECVQLLNDSVNKIFSLIERQVDICISLTNGSTFSLLINAIKEFLYTYIETFRQVVININERQFNDPKVLLKGEQSHLRSSSATIPNSLNSITTTTTPPINQDWDIFRHFVRIIHIVGDLILKYSNLEDTIEDKIKQIFTKNEKDEGEEEELGLTTLLNINNFKYFLLNDTMRGELNSLISMIESGDDYNLINDLNKPLYNLSETVHKLSFDIIFKPLKLMINNIPKSKVCFFFLFLSI